MTVCRLRSIIMSHFILSLRQVFLADLPADNPNSLANLHTSTVRFAGNLGAPLHMDLDDSDLDSHRHADSSLYESDSDPTTSATSTVSVGSHDVKASNNPLAVGLLALTSEASPVDDEEGIMGDRYTSTVRPSRIRVLIPRQQIS